MAETRAKGTIKYYGSDLNQLIDENCRRDMTCINIDCLLFDRKLKRIRIIESKHPNERVSPLQLEALRILKEFASHDGDWKSEFYIVYGNYPFLSVLVQEIDSKKRIQLNQGELVGWLEFKSDLPEPRRRFIHDFY